MNPYAILPEEMWKCILDRLATLDDLQSAYNTCQLWRSLLARKRTEWMFPGVFPSLIKYLPKADLLNCRLVSKRWNKVIDSHLEFDNPSILAIGDPNQVIFHTPPRTLIVDINMSAERQNKPVMEALTHFQSQFNPTPDSTTTVVKNPFLTRSLEISITTLNLTVQKFFKMFGSHLWYLKLSILLSQREDVLPQLHFFKFIFGILEFTPNLKKLVLVTEQVASVFHEVYSEEERNRQLQQVKQFLVTTLAPHLHQLDNLHLNVNNQWLRQALETAYAPQLTKFVRNSPFPFVPEDLVNVREVIWYYRNCCPQCHINELRKLTAPCLERLHITVVECAPWKTPADRLFAELETFKGSLKYLSLYWRWCEPFFPIRLNLPLVEELSLQIGDCRDPTFINFSFIATLKSLRKLECFFFNPIYLQLIQLHDFRRRKRRRPRKRCVDLKYHLDYDKNEGLYSSNIWELVPTLETIAIHVVDWLGEAGAKKVWVYSRVERDNNLALINRQARN